MVKASIVIPMYNAQKTVFTTLDLLAEQTGLDFEVVAVDDGSTDGTAEMVTERAREYPAPLRVLRQSHLGPAAARNLGAREAHGDIVIFLDSDCGPPPGWFEAMIEPLGGNVVGVNCGYRPANTNRLVARYVDLEIAWRHRRLVHAKHVDTLGSYSAAMLRHVFLSLGGFDTGYTAANAEDFDLGYRMARLGYKIVFTDRTFVYHHHPESLVKYLRQQFTRGYWRVRMYLNNRDKILRGDSYTGNEIQVQMVLASLALLSLGGTLTLHPALAPLAFSLLLASNLPMGIWAGQREAKMLPLATLIASLRSLVGAVAAYVGLVTFLANKVALPIKKRGPGPLPNERSRKSLSTKGLDTNGK